MKDNEVPQDKSSFTDLYYAVDKDGNYVTKTSSGWNPKKMALGESLDLIDERVKEIKQQVQDKELSPLAYYMELNRMDLSVLAAYYGKWQWMVKRHFKPSVFNKLSEKSLKKYADIFNININQLKDITLNEN
ncbi:MAG: hypothetical protein J7K34_06275 [Flavobacteriaceae bacterium]|nr:hypothetical protein [Flavobacteriaceae bacterium]